MDKLMKDVEDTNEELRSIRQKSTEEKQKLLDERDELNQKIRTLGTRLMDSERNLNKEKDSKKKIQDEYEDEIKRLKKELEQREKYWQDREGKPQYAHT